MKVFSIVLKKTGVSPVIAATLILLFTAAPFGRATSQSNEMWRSVDERSLDQSAKRVIVPMIYRTVRLDTALLTQALASAPMEFTRHPSQNPIIRLPMPDGTFARFRFEESPIMEPELAKQYPAFKTYRAQGVDDPTATSRFDWLPTGFHGIILSPAGTVLIDPYAVGNTTDYITYWKKDAANTAGSFQCHFQNPEIPDLREEGSPGPAVTSGTQFRTYRLALACTNEYATTVGSNTIAGTLAAEVLIMNRVTGVYEREVAIHFNIIGNNNLITYAGDNTSCGGPCTAANDPYTNNDGGTMLGENQANIDAVIGPANYDIGHVFSTGGGGIAQLSVVCGAGKASGVTGLSNPVGDAFAIDYVAHEMGHQFSALHPFNGTSGNCGGGNRFNSAAYEPGSGITIMAYAGICGNQNLAAHSIDTFHVKSLEEIVSYSQTGNGNTCPVTTATGNTPPSVTGPAAFTIPKKTPFTMTASATDPDSDSLTYDWQEYDLDAGGAGTMATPNTDADGTARPIFRPYLPTVGGTRTFPSLQYILNNANVPPTFGGGFLTGELLPAITRTMTFKVVARDNRAGGGGINSVTATVNIDGAAMPFAVTSPNDNISIQRLTNFNVTWTPSGNAANVKISLSTDGGTTFPTVLAASTPNNGSATVLIPDMPTTTARIKVEAVGNIYFDISDANFSIVTFQPTPTPTFAPTPSPTPTPVCPPGWQAGPPLPVVATVRAVGTYFPANARLYVMGGRSADTAGSDNTHPFEYDPTSNTWMTKGATYPDNQVNNMACTVLTVAGTPQIYCVGGSAAGATTATARVFSYNPATDTITTLAAADNWPGNTTGTILPGGFAVVGNKLYIMGGFQITTNMVQGTWQFDPTAAQGSRWLQRQDYPVPRGYIPAAAINGIIYTAGGPNTDGTTLTDTNDSFKYDPVANTWTAIANIPRATGETRAVVLNNQMWVLGGGRTLPNPSNEVDIYDPGTNTWGTGTAFTTARRNFPADTDGTHVYLAGGYDNTGTALLNTMEIFGPGICGPTPTPGVTPTPTPIVTATPTPVITATPTPVVTATPTPVVTQTPCPNCTPTPTPVITATPTPCPNCTPTPTPVITATPTPCPNCTPTPTPGGATPTPGGSTPTPTPNPGPAQALNLSTRLLVQTGSDVGIAGFIITGNDPIQILIRGLGPSLGSVVSNPLVDPILELHGPAGFTTVINDNWRDFTPPIPPNVAPSDDLESAILVTLNPGSYTAILKGQNNGVGVGLVELYDLSTGSASKLGNISTRAFVNTGNDIVIAGFILGNGTQNDTIVARGIGPSLSAGGVPDPLANPKLELRDRNGAVVISNDNWMDDPVQAAELTAFGLAPTNMLESGLVATVAPDAYTALLSGVNNGTGVGLVEVYDNPVASGPTPTPTSTPGGGTPTPTPGGGTPTPTPGPPCTENFDGVTAPALPAGWVASNPVPGDGVMFVTSTSTPDSAPNSAFIPDQDGISDKVLDRSGITVNSASAMLTFRNNFDSEMSMGVFWDGGVLEVSTPSISNGDFLDVTDPHIGGTIMSGGYTGEISGDAMNPLAGRMAWSGSSGGYIDTVINLGPNLNGLPITLRWRFGTDEATAAPGWNIDNLSIMGASCP